MLPDSIFQIFRNLFEYRCIKRTMEDNSCCYRTRTSYLSPERGANNCHNVITQLEYDVFAFQCFERICMNYYNNVKHWYTSPFIYKFNKSDKKNSQHTPQWRWPKISKILKKKTADCQNYNYFISHLIDYLFDCSRTGSVGLAFQYALLLTLYPVFESSVKFYPKIKQFHTPAISIHETWQVLTYFRGNGGH